jgi:hypothetical protein
VIDGVVESPIYAPQEVPLGCKAQRFFIPLIFSGGIWSACGGLLSTPAFPAGTISDGFYTIFFLLFFLAFLILVIYMPLSKLDRELVKIWDLCKTALFVRLALKLH